MIYSVTCHGRDLKVLMEMLGDFGWITGRRKAHPSGSAFELGAGTLSSRIRPNADRLDRFEERSVNLILLAEKPGR